ncbi:MAG: energy-coupling factor ABC transporter permease [Candidatus Bathyarchaeia archaeon]
MHIMDGILTPFWVAVWFVIAAPFIVVGLVKIARKRREDPAYMPLLALMGATIFIVSVWHIPVPVTGSCSHPCGVALSAILVGPFESVVLSFIALFFQMFLAHGGVTTLGANTVSMGIVGGFLGYAIYLALRKLRFSFWLSAGLGGFFGDLATYIVTAGQLAFSLHLEEPLQYWGIFSAGFLPTQVPLAILELVLTAAVIRYVAITKPEMLGGLK